MSNFRKGAKAAEDAAKSGGGSKFAKLEYFSIKDATDPTRIVRFLTDYDEWITTSMHPSMPTRPKPDDIKGNWPKSMGAVCRMDSNGGQRTFPDHADCFHCITPGVDGKPRKKNDRTWAIGLLREEVTLQDGTRVFQDKTKVVTHMKADGSTEEREEPFYVIICMAWSNFWSPIEAIAQMRGTCLDRDYRITRKGFTMNDTDYAIAAYDPVQVDLGDGKGMRVLDFRDEEILSCYPDRPDLGEFVTNQASDEFYDRFFDVRHAFPSSSAGRPAAAGVAAATSATVATPTTEVPQHELEALANRLTGGTATAYPAQAGRIPASVPLS